MGVFVAGESLRKRYRFLLPATIAPGGRDPPVLSQRRWLKKARVSHGSNSTA
jgi:hypothetical protein